MRTFVVQFWSTVFSALRWVSPFQLMGAAFPRTAKTYGFVDAWVLGHLLLSFACLALSPTQRLCWWRVVILSYGAIRLFEIVVYHINVLLFDAYREVKAGRTYAVRSFRRLILLLLHNYIEIVFWFSLSYRNFSWAFTSRGAICLNSLAGSLYFSIVTISTLGYGDVTPERKGALLLVTAQTLIGLFMALMILARFVSLIPRPLTLDRLEKREN